MSESQPLRRSLQIALAAALVVLAAGVVFAFTQHGRYKAETSLIVLPANTLDAADQANFLETLSRGQVTATMAEVAQSGRFEDEAEKAMGLSTSEAADSSVTVTVVPSTSVLLIKSDASSAKVAEGLADRTAALAATYLKTMIKPYTASQVSSAAGTAYAAGTATWMVLAGALAAALAVAVAAQQAAYQILQGRRRTRRVPPLRRPVVPATGRAGVGAVPAGAATSVAPSVPAAPAAEMAAPSAGNAVGTSTVVGTSSVPGSFSSSNDWSSPSVVSTPSSSTYTSSVGLGSGSSDWRSGTNGSSYSTNGSAGSTGDADSAEENSSQSDSHAPADEAGVTNERVLFS